MKKIMSLLMFSLTIFYFMGCNKEEIGALPEVTTISAVDLTETSFSCGGIIISDGRLEITEMGVCWDSIANPTISNSKISFKPCPTHGDTIEFKVTITNLITKTWYKYRAYAINAAGTAYGETFSICTCK